MGGGGWWMKMDMDDYSSDIRPIDFSNTIQLLILPNQTISISL